MAPTREVLESSLREIAARADTIERTVPSIVGDYRRLGGCGDDPCGNRAVLTALTDPGYIPEG